MINLQNQAIVNRLADLSEQYTVGTGLHFFPNTDDAIWNRGALEFWEGWKRYADLASRQSFRHFAGYLRSGGRPVAYYDLDDLQILSCLNGVTPRSRVRRGTACSP